MARQVLIVLAALALVGPTAAGKASASDLVTRNPFDPHRQPWKTPPPAAPDLPVLTPQDLQIEAIISFGTMQGIIAQLDGKLRGSLPSNAAGKVRINVGQSFGSGYVLESIDANQAVVLGGSARYSIPVVRKMNRGTAPAPATMAAEQRATPPSANAPISAPGPVGAVSPQPVSVTAAPVPLVPPPPPFQAATQQAATASEPMAATAQPPQTPPQQPMSLLEAIQAAQAAARNQQGPSQPVANPFVIPKK